MAKQEQPDKKPIEYVPLFKYGKRVRETRTMADQLNQASNDATHTVYVAFGNSKGGGALNTALTYKMNPDKSYTFMYVIEEAIKKSISVPGNEGRTAMCLKSVLEEVKSNPNDLMLRIEAYWLYNPGFFQGREKGTILFSSDKVDKQMFTHNERNLEILVDQYDGFKGSFTTTQLPPHL